MAGGASVQPLRSFRRDERAAAARYRRALPLFTDRAETDELRACLASHERRIETLVGRIRQMGEQLEGEDEDEHGDGDGDRDAIGLLEESEDRGLRHYLEGVCRLDLDTRRLIAREVLPEQVRTYDSLADLRLLHLH